MTLVRIDEHPDFGSIVVYYAEQWFRDACWEARRPESRGDLHCRRRELVLAVSFAESYLFEWVAAAVGWSPSKLEHYFPSKDRGIAEKWRRVPQALFAAGLLQRQIRTSATHDKNWERLLSYRNGLVHSHASWPEHFTPRPGQRRPRPSMTDLVQMVPGWAVSVARERVLRLHSAAGDPLPPWLQSCDAPPECPACGHPREEDP